MEYDIRDFFSEEDIDGRIEVEKFMSELPLREKQIFYLYYLCEHTQEEVGELLGLTKGRICQILSEIKQNGTPIEGIYRGM